MKVSNVSRCWGLFYLTTYCTMLFQLLAPPLILLHYFFSKSVVGIWYLRVIVYILGISESDSN